MSSVIQIPDLVRGMSDLLQRSLGPSISIQTHFPLKMSPVNADANQLEMALLNLAVNSRDAMPEGGQIIIAAQEEQVSAGNASSLKPGRYVRLSVIDTGEGMDAETLRRATEPFFTTKGLGKGTGLGVPMVHGLAEQFGGRFNLGVVRGKVQRPKSGYRQLRALRCLFQYVRNSLLKKVSTNRSSSCV